MKVYFIRNSETIEKNLGVSKDPFDSTNIPSHQGLYDISKVTSNIVKDLKGVDPKNVYIYTGSEQKCSLSTGAIVRTLRNANMISDKNVKSLDGLNSRDYGKLKGVKEDSLKSAKYMFLHPMKAISYGMSNIGLKNPSRIQTVNDYNNNVFGAIYEIVVTHQGKDDVVIISSTADVFESMQKDEGTHSMCYFGYEKVPYLTSKKQKFGKEKIDNAEVKTIEMGMPVYDAVNDRWIPVWESLALRDYYNEVAKEFRDEELESSLLK